MFSSSSSSGGGGFGGADGGGGGGAGECGCGSNGGNGNSSGVLSSVMKKQQKRPKIPKRGPGVAELEKILREDAKSERGININNINTTSSNNNNVEGFSVSHPYFNPRRLSPPPPTPPPPRTSRPPPPPPSSHHIPIAPRFDHLNPPPPGLYGYNTAKQQEGRNFPEQPLFPMNPSSCDGLSQPDNDHQHLHRTANSLPSKNFHSESSKNHHHLWSSYPPLPQERHCTNQYSSSMVKQILGPRAPRPSSSSLTTGHFNHEPPSSQSPYFNSTSARNPTEEPKMVGMRPHRSSSFENSLVSSSNFQVSPFLPNLITRPHNKSSSNNDTHISTSNFTSSTNDCFRDVKWGITLGLNSFGSEISNAGSGHFSSLINDAAAAPIPTPHVPSPSLHMFQRELSNNNNHQVPQERMEDSNQKSESSSGASDRQIRFYNFLEVKEVEDTKETILRSNDDDSEVGSNGLDLTLKL